MLTFAGGGGAFVQAMSKSKEASKDTLRELLVGAEADPVTPKAMHTHEEEEEAAAVATAMRAVEGQSSAEILSGMDQVRCVRGKSAVATLRHHSDGV
jgi:hypothetical protein